MKGAGVKVASGVAVAPLLLYWRSLVLTRRCWRVEHVTNKTVVASMQRSEIEV